MLCLLQVKMITPLTSARYFLTHSSQLGGPLLPDVGGVGHIFYEFYMAVAQKLDNFLWTFRSSLKPFTYRSRTDQFKTFVFLSRRDQNIFCGPLLPSLPYYAQYLHYQI